ncbi:hypothetical protein [Bradyrhizobium sp. AZCC 2289]|uniref:hypothetical protein n=1 Tax=Bradyrhizobium sp. AZCC 2289 TaxID=3117026 RepID=UPI002FF34719
MEGETLRGARASDIFAISHYGLNYVPSGAQRRRAMWRMSGIEALIFIAVVAIAVALLLLA